MLTLYFFFSLSLSLSIKTTLNCLLVIRKPVLHFTSLCGFRKSEPTFEDRKEVKFHCLVHPPCQLGEISESKEIPPATSSWLLVGLARLASLDGLAGLARLALLVRLALLAELAGLGRLARPVTT